jgi:hypothetical protein
MAVMMIVVVLVCAFRGPLTGATSCWRSSLWITFRVSDASAWMRGAVLPCFAALLWTGRAWFWWTVHMSVWQRSLVASAVAFPAGAGILTTKVHRCAHLCKLNFIASAVSATLFIALYPNHFILRFLSYLGKLNYNWNCIIISLISHSESCLLLKTLSCIHFVSEHQFIPFE